ncbi:PEP-CTERM sorting domain-containing protein [Paludisphaera mucosa]|uniref:PEP-CTERM sorting domain-containing protein n=1 Tax=Paludisphaera mucosa TaxID=3030827 RepID=A0ABT6FC67_9BACT|nr:PEP-CTERM sorting domain-containing protein [Paludisphaera mucosa]MDG3005182.1 PEP-CTERM sorting domain-containing protein [Paludisphaera mucosa]
MPSPLRAPRAWLVPVVLTALAVVAPHEAWAAPISPWQPDGPRFTLTYSTSLIGRNLNTSSGDGLPGVTFQGVQDRTILSPAPFQVGSFPQALPGGSVVDLPLGTLDVHIPSDASPEDGEMFRIRLTVWATDAAGSSETMSAQLMLNMSLIEPTGPSGGLKLSYGFFVFDSPPPIGPPGSIAGVLAQDGFTHLVLAPPSWQTIPVSADGVLALDAKLVTAQVGGVPVPEPSTWLVFAGTVAAFGLRRMRRSKSSFRSDAAGPDRILKNAVQPPAPARHRTIPLDDIQEGNMLSPREFAHTRALSTILTGLVVLAAAGREARAVPIPTQITYSTSGPEASHALPTLGPYEFHPVTDGLATVGSELKLGMILVHRQEAGQYMPVLGIPFPIEFRVTKFGEAPLPAGGASIQIDNFINHYIRTDGTVVGNMEMFIRMDPLDGGKYDPVQVGPISLSLKPIAVPPNWDQRPDQEVVAVDVYARLEGAPVPEPATWVVFALGAVGAWRATRTRAGRSRA